jgi:hypothetical protein
MGEEVLVEQRQITINDVTAQKISTHYTPDDCLSSIGISLHVPDGSEEGTRKPLQISDGYIREAMTEVYEAEAAPIREAHATAVAEAELAHAIAVDEANADHAEAVAAAEAAGLSPEDDAYPEPNLPTYTAPEIQLPTRGNEQQAWGIITMAVEENNVTAQEIVDTLKVKKWGKVMLRKAVAG